jgi:hypothetical protein
MTNLQSTIEDLKLMMTCNDLWWDRIDVLNINMYPKRSNCYKSRNRKNKSSHYLSL